MAGGDGGDQLWAGSVIPQLSSMWTRAVHRHPCQPDAHSTALSTPHSIGHYPTNLIPPASLLTAATIEDNRLLHCHSRAYAMWIEIGLVLLPNLLVSRAVHMHCQRVPPVID